MYVLSEIGNQNSIWLIGVKEGTVVVTKQAVDGLLRPFHEQVGRHFLSHQIRISDYYDYSFLEKLLF